jgi:glycosyltransferase involved in cell wall biosynthesis
LLNEGRDIQLAIAGRIPNWPADLVAYADELQKAAANADGRVRFLGPVEDVRGLLEKACLLVAPIEGEEGFGTVILEAKAAGIPVVTTCRGGLPEQVVHGENGWVCKTVDVESVAEGMAYFLDDQARKDRAAEISRAELEDPRCPYRRENFERQWRDRFRAARKRHSKVAAS